MLPARYDDDDDDDDDDIRILSILYLCQKSTSFRLLPF